jgi:pimeloyl-ACP methyl ester carboxylesterase
LLLAATSYGQAALAEPPSKYIRNEGSDTALVFIHGVLGDAISTWTNGDAYWPELLTKDHDFDGTDIFILSYPTNLWSTASINELAAMAQLTLNGMGVTNRSNLIFVVHSMGGLILRQYLLTHRDVAAKTKFAYFFSTPTEGSQVAAFASFILTTPQIRGMQPIKSTDDLANTIRDWINSGIQVSSYCAYELLPTFGKIVVPFQSASNLCNQRIYPIQADHQSIVKPADMNAPSYLALKEAFKEKKAGRFGINDSTIKQYGQILRDINATLIKSKEELIPQISAYIASPTPARWQMVRESSAALLSQIQEGVRRSMDFDAQFFEVGTRIIQVADDARQQTVDQRFYFKEVRQQWNGRSFDIHEILGAEHPPTTAEAIQWRDDLQKRYDALSTELSKLIEVVAAKT